MQLRTRLALTLGGLLASILIVSGTGLIATGGLAKRIETLDQASVLTRHLNRIESARRAYQASGSAEDLEITRDLIADASDEIQILEAMGREIGDQSDSILGLDDSFARYKQLVDAYADSERRKAEARAHMGAQLSGMKSIATRLKWEKESDYHRAFAVAASIEEAEDRLKSTLRLTALANEITVVQMAIERAVALYKAGDRIGAAEIPLEIARIAEIADRIRRIEEVKANSQPDEQGSSLPDQLAESSNQFQAGFDDFRLATRDQARREQEMAEVAVEVTQLIQNINERQAEAAVKSSNWTLTLSLVGVATALLLGGLAALVIRNRIIAPLTAITQTMQRMSAGQLDLPVPGHRRRDELGAMARALEVFRQTSLEARRLTEEKLDIERRLGEEKAEAAFLEQSLHKEKELNAQQRRFVALVSHEFRTPLAIIDGQAQRLVRRGDSLTVDQRTTALEKVRSAITRLTGLMESVLSSASLEAGSIALNPGPMNLRELVQKACESQQEISSNHKITIDIDALPESYLGDSKLLNQVLTNLLSNAVKYSPDADRVDVIGREQGEVFEISVRDFGVGIPEGELPNLCQRFFRASTSTGIQGTGIGLNLVKALVEMHGGALEVASTEGEGSTFTVRLPRELPADDALASAA